MKSHDQINLRQITLRQMKSHHRQINLRHHIELHAHIKTRRQKTFNEWRIHICTYSNFKGQ